MDGPTDGSRFPRPARGFTLIEIVVVLFILGVAISMAAAITNALTASQRLSTTTARMQAIDAALVQFVMQQKRLPCPADGRLASTDNNAGLERRNAGSCNVNGAGTEQHGVVPWVTLGLSESDATDGWNRRFTYRTDLALVADNALDMSSCDPAKDRTGVAAGICSATCTSANVAGTCTAPFDFLLGKGLKVQRVDTSIVMDPLSPPVNAATSPPPTGAAYVVISAGSTGGGAYLSSGVIGTSTTTDGTQEAKNYADKTIQGYYVDDSISDGAGNSHFDDIVSRPALLTVINKAGLGPRSHT
jgi:prepilin-type N-terminal cleavage/methylation domain-containing protein